LRLCGLLRCIDGLCLLLAVLGLLGVGLLLLDRIGLGLGLGQGLLLGSHLLLRHGLGLLLVSGGNFSLWR